MATAQAQLKTELLQSEQAYLEAVRSKDGPAASRLTAPESLVVSGHGPMKVDGAKISKMIAEHDSSRQYELDDGSVEIVQVTDGVAIIAYRLKTTTSKGESADAFDTDVWVRYDGQWKCALLTEIPAEATPDR
ncbi:MAG: nuclear transport factor 2 family protein [Chloroflexi bacterium]|nr:nuclear transport factor 2 family protein [Chloroflexota bacterium]